MLVQGWSHPSGPASGCGGATSPSAAEVCAYTGPKLRRQELLDGCLQVLQVSPFFPKFEEIASFLPSTGWNGCTVALYPVATTGGLHAILQPCSRWRCWCTSSNALASRTRPIGASTPGWCMSGCKVRFCCSGLVFIHIGAIPSPWPVLSLACQCRKAT